MSDQKISELPESSAIAKLAPAVENFKAVFANNEERKSRALLVTKTITEIPVEDDKKDKYANDVLVKCGITYNEIKDARLGATKILDEAKAWAMGPEKELEAEMIRIRKLRDARAAIIKDKNDADAKAIEMQKAYTVYEGKIKSNMKATLELGVANKLRELEDGLAKVFADITLAKIDGLDPYLAGIKPSLKEDLFNKLIRVSYDQNIMTEEQYENLVARAKEFFNFEKTNKVYVDLATKTIAAWREKIPAKKIELQKIATATGENKAKLEQQAQQRKANEERERKLAQEEQEKSILENAQNEERSDALNAEFTAAQQQMNINEQAGTRTTRKFRIAGDVEKDMVKLAALLGKLVLHAMIAKEPDGSHKFSIFKHTKGVAKTSEDGYPQYIDGIQDWLDMAAKIPYANGQFIPGLVPIQKVSTVAKVEKPKAQ